MRGTEGWRHTREGPVLLQGRRKEENGSVRRELEAKKKRLGRRKGAERRIK